RRVAVCSFTTNPSREILVELQRWTSDHALRTEERQDQVILAIDQRAHARHAVLLEARDQRLEQRGARALQAELWLDLDGEHPAGRRLAELPGADLAGDEAGHYPLLRLGQQEVSAGSQHFLPIGRLLGAGQARVQGGNRR